ncbi:MAG: sigma factor-like helix-turn-helix DNA-binding protein [Clostridiales bacterium]|nr:sigma factor-like helix-turn-helix DNA-binding protein [Clostridiales bacterium]
MSKNLEISVLLDYYGGMLTDKQRDVIDLYYNQDLSLAEIAEHEKISRQGVRDNIKRGEAYLTELEENLHMAKQAASLLHLLEEIQRRNREIYRINEENKFSAEIKENAVVIEDKLKSFLKEYE